METMSLFTTRHPRQMALGAALTAGVLISGPLSVNTAHAAVACRSDPIVVLSNGVVLDLSVTLDADVSQVQEIHYKLHGPHGVLVVRAISTDGPVQYKEHFEFKDDSHGNDTSAGAPATYWVEVQTKTADGHHTGWATIAGGYVTDLGITPAMVGLTAFQFNPSAPQGDAGTGKGAPKPPHADDNVSALPDTVTTALAAWASNASWHASMSSPPGQADQILTESIAL
jgi:hypothetical protein